MAKATLGPRPEDWPARLSAYLDERRNVPFAWGSNDCCLFAANWLRVCHGVDLARPWRGKYKSEASALKVLKAAGGVRGVVDGLLPRVKLAFANRGDVVAYRDPNRNGPAWAVTSLGVLDGRHALFATPTGLAAIPRDNLMKTAWRVGAP